MKNSTFEQNDTFVAKRCDLLNDFGSQRCTCTPAKDRFGKTPRSKDSEILGSDLGSHPYVERAGMSMRCVTDGCLNAIHGYLMPTAKRAMKITATQIVSTFEPVT